MSTYTEDDEQFEAQSIVVNPAKLFPNDNPNDWASSLSNQGMLKLYVDCHFGVSGIQGTISEARPPPVGDEIDTYGDGFRAGTQVPGEWDGYEMLGFIQIPTGHAEYTIQLFFKSGTSFDRRHETIYIQTLEEGPDVEPQMFGKALLETEWAHIYKEVFVKNFDAAPLAGHKWATCPCDECSSPTSKGICSTP